MSPIEINVSLTKKCSSCKQTKPRAEFTKNKTKTDGLGPSCRPCHRAQDKAYRARRTPEFKAKRWERERTPAKRLRDQIGRHLRLHGGDLAGKPWVDLVKRCRNKCLRCKIHAKKTRLGILTIDHIVPCPKGTNSIDNVQPLCGPCNSKKGKKEDDYRPDSLRLRKGPGVEIPAKRDALAS